MEIKNNQIRVWTKTSDGEWAIKGRRTLEVSYHPDWQANVEILIAEKTEDETPIEFRLCVLSVEAPYKLSVYREAILFSVADRFRRFLWEHQPSPPTNLAMGS